MDGDLKQVLNNNFPQIAEKYPSNNCYQNVFWNQHSQAASCKNVQGVHWHPAMIRWCLYLRHLSGKGYETLRSTGVLQIRTFSAHTQGLYALCSGNNWIFKSSRPNDYGYIEGKKSAQVAE